MERVQDCVRIEKIVQRSRREESDCVYANKLNACHIHSGLTLYRSKSLLRMWFFFLALSIVFFFLWKYNNFVRTKAEHAYSCVHVNDDNYENGKC